MPYKRFVKAASFEILLEFNSRDPIYTSLFLQRRYLFSSQSTSLRSVLLLNNIHVLPYEWPFSKTFPHHTSVCNTCVILTTCPIHPNLLGPHHDNTKAVPLHATNALRGRGRIAPTHSRPRHWMGVSGQRHAPDALYPRGKDHGTHCTGGWVGPRADLDTVARGKILRLCRGSNIDRPVVARHYRYWPSYLRIP
jgi:hypothetical protein